MSNLVKYPFMFSVAFILKKEIIDSDPVINFPPTDYKLDYFNKIMKPPFPGNLGDPNRGTASGDLILKNFNVYAGRSPRLDQLPTPLQRYSRVIFAGLAEGTIFTDGVVDNIPFPVEFKQEGAPENKGGDKFNVFLDEIFGQEVYDNPSNEGDPVIFMDTTNVPPETFGWVIFRLPRDCDLGPDFIMGGDKH